MQMHRSAPLRRGRFVCALITLAAGLSCAGLVLFALQSLADKTIVQPATTQMHVNAATQFEYVVVFPADTPSSAIETWRRDVLVRSHTQACNTGHSCVRRLLRGSTRGTQRVEAFAFDLAADTPVAERTALLTAAVAHAAHPRIEQVSSMQGAAELRLSPLPRNSAP